MNGIAGQKVVVHLLILADQPYRAYMKNIHGYRDWSKPLLSWNKFPSRINSKTWYSNLFTFIDVYLHNDGSLIVFMLHGLTFELYKAT